MQTPSMSCATHPPYGCRKVVVCQNLGAIPIVQSNSCIQTPPRYNVNDGVSMLKRLTNCLMLRGPFVAVQVGADLAVVLVFMAIISARFASAFMQVTHQKTHSDATIMVKF